MDVQDKQSCGLHEQMIQSSSSHEGGKKGIDYRETFVLMAKMTIMRTVIALVVKGEQHTPRRKARVGSLYDATTQL